MKKVVLVIFLLAISSIIFAQDPGYGEKDYSLARVGKKTQGVYLFIGTEPFYKYDYVATIKAKIELFEPKSYDRTIKKAKKKYPYFNGLIFNGRGKDNKLSPQDKVKLMKKLAPQKLGRLEESKRQEEIDEERFMIDKEDEAEMGFDQDFKEEDNIAGSFMDMDSQEIPEDMAQEEEEEEVEVV